MHQDLVRDYGFEGSYNTVRRYVERSRPKPRARRRSGSRPGPGFRRRSTGLTSSRSGPARGWSCRSTAFTWSSATRRDSFCRLTGSQDLVTFWACHRAAFTHFGGVPHELLYDRTKTVVRQHVGRDVTIEERIFHPEALASAHHYGFSMRLCQAYRAKTKGKVEHDVPYVRERLLRGHSFTSYEQANIAWCSWNEEIARQRKHGTHGEIVAVRAERDHAALLPVPPTRLPGRRAHHPRRGADGFFSFEGRRYYVPDAKPGERVELVLGASELEVHSLLDGRRFARHERGRPSRVLPDPVEDSVSLAQVLSALPTPRSIAGRLTATRRRSMGELITERIRRNARELKLYGLADTADELVDRAEAGKLGYREFLDLVLESEVGVLEGRRYASRLKLSGLPHHKTLDEFDASFQPELDPKRLAELRSLRFVQNKVSSLILGPPGVGKTHLAVGSAMEALRAGYLVRYTTLDDVVRELRQADQLGTLRNKLAHYQRPHALIVDEVGYLQTRARRREPVLPADQPPLHPLLDDRHQQQARVRMGRAVRRRSPSRRDPRPPPARRRGPHHQRPLVAAPRPRRPPSPSAQKRREPRKQPDRCPSATPPRAAEGLTRRRLNPSPPPQGPKPCSPTPISAPSTSPATAHSGSQAATDRHFSMAIDRRFSMALDRPR